MDVKRGLPTTEGSDNNVRDGRPCDHPKDERPINEPMASTPEMSIGRA
jgi:hypothetical protein